MTAGINMRSAGCLFFLAAFAPAIAGCASSTPDVAALGSRSGAVADTGQYPNLNVARPTAATQFTDEERDAKIASLKAAGLRSANRRSGQGGTVRSEAELARLGRNHGDDVLKEIEAK